MNKRKLTTFRVIVLGFVAVILTGSVLLSLPICNNEHIWLNPLESLFTATSATCVTGLIVRDTGTFWNVIGKTVILLMIQIGGMGVVTITILISLIAGKKISLASRNNLKDALSLPKVGGILNLTSFIIRTTFIVEAIAAFVLCFVFVPKYNLLKGIGMSVFTSISAFCNAGFDLIGNGESLISLSDNTLANSVIMSVIVIGGIGFLTWSDIKNHKLNIRKYTLQSKIILTTYSLLLILPAIYFFFFEFDSYDISFKERVLVSLFQSVTCRTAGFNTVDLAELNTTSKVLMIGLMLIGGAPGSTAGGMKVTTIAVLVLSMRKVFTNDDEIESYGRSVSDENVINAAAILMMYLILFFISGVVISIIENIDILLALFETASAVGTVGVTLGITSSLSAVSKIIIIVLMFIGRVGGLTLIFATTKNRNNTLFKLPEERVTVG